MEKYSRYNMEAGYLQHAQECNPNAAMQTLATPARRPVVGKMPPPTLADNLNARSRTHTSEIATYRNDIFTDEASRGNTGTSHDTQTGMEEELLPPTHELCCSRLSFPVVTHHHYNIF